MSQAALDVYQQEVLGALTISRYSTYAQDCEALKMNRGDVLNHKWSGKGYFQILKDEKDNGHLFWDAIEKGEILATTYTEATLEELKGRPLSEVLSKHSKLFQKGVIARGDEITQAFYKQSEKIQNLQGLEGLYTASIFSIGLLDANDPQMKNWIINEIEQIISLNISRERYKKCLGNSLVSEALSNLLESYDQGVKTLDTKKATSLQEAQETCANDKAQVSQKLQEELSYLDKDLERAKDAFETKRTEYLEAEKVYRKAVSEYNECSISLSFKGLELQRKTKELASYTSVDETERQHEIGKIPTLKSELEGLNSQIQKIQRTESTLTEQIQQKKIQLIPAQERKLDHEKLTLKLKELNESQEKLPKEVTGLKASQELEEKQKKIAIQITETSNQIKVLSSLLSPEKIQTAIDSLQEQKIKLEDISLKKKRALEIQKELLPLEQAQKKIQIKVEISKLEEQCLRLTQTERDAKRIKDEYKFQIESVEYDYQVAKQKYSQKGNEVGQLKAQKVESCKKVHTFHDQELVETKKYLFMNHEEDLRSYRAECIKNLKVFI